MIEYHEFVGNDETHDVIFGYIAHGDDIASVNETENVKAGNEDPSENETENDKAGNENASDSESENVNEFERAIDDENASLFVCGKERLWASLRDLE